MLYKRIFIAIITIFAVSVIFIGGNSAGAEETKWLWPTKGEITDVFGTRGGHHNGVDIGAPLGTPVVAMHSGVVTKSYYSGTYGNVVFILHNNGFESVYAHLNERLVTKGEKVSQGQLIGKVGSTGRSTGSHLHFEIHQGRWNIDKTNAVNPVALLEGPQFMAEGEDLIETSVSQMASINVNVENPNEVRSKEPMQELKSGANQTIPISKEKMTKGKKVVVKIDKGDTLWGIGQKHQVSVALIKKWNDLDSSMISIGEKLVLYPNAIETYKVQKGDTLPEISRKTGVSISKLLKYNTIENQPIYPSQVLVISMNESGHE